MTLPPPSIADPAGVPPCPLCARGGAAAYHADRFGRYWACDGCALIFVGPEQHPAAEVEKARYDQHRNDPHDPRYRAFLSRLLDPLLQRVPPGARGLDFGCGPGPALALMLTEQGRPTTGFDPYYRPDGSVWTCSYDFITATEVVEHLKAPAREFDRLFAALRPGGWLAVMTRWPPDRAAFHTWRYRRDPTHVAFYSRATFAYIATRWRADLVTPAPDVALLRKREGDTASPGATARAAPR